MSETVENNTAIEKIDYKLKLKQKKFCDFIIQQKTQDEAYFLAGYKAKNNAVARVLASRLLTKANVANYVKLQREKLEKQAQEKFNLTQENMVKSYNTTIDGLQAIIDDPETDKRTKVAAYKAQKDAKDSLTRIAGLFNDKLQTVVTIKELKDLSLEQMEELIQQVN